MKLLKYLILIIILISSLNAKQNQESKILDIINNDLLTDKIKIDEIEKYIKNIKLDQLNDEFNKTKHYKFNLMSYHKNYILLVGYSNRLIERHWSNGIEDTKTKGYVRKRNEAQFQISFKLPLYQNFLNTKADLFAAYTQNSYWQVYDTKHSSPFRETNYMPELFMQWNIDKKTLKSIRLSFIHQSNGQDVGKSRSWNRTEIAFVFNKKNFEYGFNLWDRWNEDKKSDPTSTKGDDNPNLIDFIGTGKYYIRYKNDKINLDLVHQNDIFNYNINKGNILFDITFPSINKNFDFFIRYFYGYGESLIDYDVKVKRISFGIIIADGVI